MPYHHRTLNFSNTYKWEFAASLLNLKFLHLIYKHCSVQNCDTSLEETKILPKQIKFVEFSIPRSLHLSRNTSVPMLFWQKIIKYLKDERNVPVLFSSGNSQSMRLAPGTMTSIQVQNWHSYRGTHKKPRSFLKIYNAILCNPSSQLFHWLYGIMQQLHTHTFLGMECMWMCVHVNKIPQSTGNSKMPNSQ